MAEARPAEVEALLAGIAAMLPVRGDLALPVLRNALHALVDPPARPVHANGTARPAGNGVAANRVKSPPPRPANRRRPASVPVPAAQWAPIREELRAALERHSTAAARWPATCTRPRGPSAIGSRRPAGRLAARSWPRPGPGSPSTRPLRRRRRPRRSLPFAATGPEPEPERLPEPDLDPSAPAPKTCCWSDLIPGTGGRERRCEQPALAGRPWCGAHARSRAMAGRLSGLGMLAGGLVR